MANVGRMVKESIIQELSSTLAKRPNLFVTTVNRLPSAEADSLRQKLYTSQARLVLVKRRLGRRTVEQLNVPGLAELLEGSVGLVLPGEDVLPAAKLIVDFIKTHEDQLAVRGGMVDGQLLDKTHVEELASLPPKPILLAQVVATLESPMADVIFTLEQLIGDVAWLLGEGGGEKTPLPATQAGGQAEATPAQAASPLPETPTQSGAPAAPTAQETTPKQEEGTPS